MDIKIIETVTISRNKYVLCICPKCGSEWLVRHRDIVSGKSKTCGCANKKYIDRNKHKFGNEIFNRWTGIKQRVSHCPEYVKKGIDLCAEWYDFKSFYDWAIIGFDPLLEIDRMNNKLGYCPENCRWVTRLENLRNRDKQTINEEQAFNIKIDCLNGIDKKTISKKYNCSWAIVHSIYINKAWKDICGCAEMYWMETTGNTELPIIIIKKRGYSGNKKPFRKYSAMNRRIEYQKYAKTPKILVNEIVCG